jgi:hypothetical protein
MKEGKMDNNDKTENIVKEIKEWEIQVNKLFKDDKIIRYKKKPKFGDFFNLINSYQSNKDIYTKKKQIFKYDDNKLLKVHKIWKDYLHLIIKISLQIEMLNSFSSADVLDDIESDMHETHIQIKASLESMEGL